MHQDWHSNIRTQKIKTSIIKFWTSHQEKAFFYRQMSVMLKAGIPVDAAIRQLKSQQTTEKIGEMLLPFIEKGKPLSNAMENSGKLFSTLEIRTISAGEISGNLAELLEKLAMYFETLQDVKYKLVSGMIYPAILLHAAIIIPAVPLLFTKSVFAFLARILPPFILIYGAGFGVYFVYKTLSKPEMEEIRDTLVLKAPLGFGKLVKTVAVIRFLQAFICLYSAGVPVVEAVKIAGKASGNKLIEKEILISGKLVEQGFPLSSAFSGSNFLPPLVIDMFQTGEQSGRMDETLEKAAWHLQNDVNLAVEAILKIIPVVVYLIVAFYVATIVFSFYARYFSQINSLLE